jgi:signal peptidase I
MGKKKVRFRSYKDKKTKSKSFRVNFLRIVLFFTFFMLFTTYVATGYRIPGETMFPSLNKGDVVLTIPFNSIKLFNAQIGKNLKRGDLVIAGTNYESETSLVQKIFDPIVRTLTLQNFSLIYDNKDYKGHSDVFRIVGLPGDSIKIQDYTVYIKPQGEEYFLSEFELTKSRYDIKKTLPPNSWKSDYPFSANQEEVKLGESKYYLISDNRHYLNDSRIFGAVDRNRLKGRVLFKYWPLGNFFDK